MAAGETPLIGADSPFTQSVVEGQNLPYQEQVARPRDFQPLGEQVEVYAGPCGSMR
jgi:hypothetical protein